MSELMDALQMTNEDENLWDHRPAGRYFLGDTPPAKWNVVFARVSTGEQVREGFSLVQQVESGIALGKRRGKQVSTVYLDPGKSATRLTFDRRAGIRGLLEDVRSGLIHTIFVYKRDRVARQSGEWMHFWRTCQSHGVSILFTCSSEPPIGEGIYGKVQEGIMSLWAELEAEHISIRVRDSIVSRFQKGEWIGGQLPFGLTRSDDGKIIPHPIESPIVEEIFRSASEELFGAARIARRLNETRPMSRRGSMWTRYSVLKVLRTRTYSGTATLHTEVDEDGHRQRVCLEQRTPNLPIVIPSEVWDAAFALRKGRTKTAGATTAAHMASPNLLVGRVFCATCGRPLHVKHCVRKNQLKDGTVTRYHMSHYYCRHAADVKGCSQNGTIAKHLLETAVVAWCEQVFQGVPHPEVRRIAEDLRRKQCRDMRDRHAAAHKELAQTVAALVRNQQVWEAASDPRQVRYYQARVRELIDRHDELEGILNQLSAQIETNSVLAVDGITIAQHQEQWSELWTLAPEEHRRALMAEIVKRVTYDHATRSIDIELSIATSATGNA